MRKKVIITGTPAKIFHVFNTCYRGRREYCVQCFSSTQVANGKVVYPASLSGELYPGGISIQPEDKLSEIVTNKRIDEVVFAYSGSSFEYISRYEQMVYKLGADFKLANVGRCMLPGKKYSIAVYENRATWGKFIVNCVLKICRQYSQKVAVCCDPFPVKCLLRQRIQRYATLTNVAEDSILERRKKYRQYVQYGAIVYTGLDSGEVLQLAQREADVILWIGSDIPFVKPDLYISIVDPRHIGYGMVYYPERINVELADVVIIPEFDNHSQAVVAKIKKFNDKAILLSNYNFQNKLYEMLSHKFIE